MAFDDDQTLDEGCEHCDQDDRDFDKYFDSDSDVAEDTCSQLVYPYGFGSTTTPVQWRLLKIGESVLHVSSEGKIKPYKSMDVANEGFLLHGTPYRTYPVEHPTRHMYVHDLVWQAFHGAIPDGWEVRHTDDHTRTPKKTYSNALRHITIYPRVVCG